MLGIFTIVQFVFSFQNEEYDEGSFLILNVDYPDYPMTLYNYENNEKSVSIRLSQISKENLHAEVFVLRFDMYNHLWISPSWNQDYKLINAGQFITAKYKPIENNLFYKKVSNQNWDDLYKIISHDRRCLQVDGTSKQDYIKLIFDECGDKSSQRFKILSVPAAQLYLDKTTRTQQDIKKGINSEIQLRERFAKIFKITHNNGQMK